MFLIVDIGNTNITIGLVENQNIKKVYRFNTPKDVHEKLLEDLFFKIFNNIKIDGCIISSVVIELNNIVKQAIDNVLKVNSLILSKDNVDIGIKIATLNPSEVGADRIANAYAASKLYGYPAIIVDMGTATTFDIIDEKGAFIGGIIMPGINTQLNSLCHNTSLLPQLEPEHVDKVIGNDTKSSILSGVIRGHAAAIDELLKECKKELKSKRVKVIGTGGNVDLVSTYMKQSFDEKNIELTLEGIKMIYELNVQKAV